MRKIHTIICYDVLGPEGVEDGQPGIPREEHIVGAFQFADQIAGEPILIHCWAGVSRSTAMALGLIVRALHLDGYSVGEIETKAPDLLIAIRPQAAPNPLILELCLMQFMSAEEATQTTRLLVNHPVLLANRHKNREAK